MPTHTTFFSGLPVCPTHSPDRTRSEKSLIESRTLQTPGTTLAPSSSMTALRDARNAVCSTARSSVTLRCSPENMASILSRSCAVWASAMSFCMPCQPRAVRGAR